MGPICVRIVSRSSERSCSSEVLTLSFNITKAIIDSPFTSSGIPHTADSATSL